MSSSAEVTQSEGMSAGIMGEKRKAEFAMGRAYTRQALAKRALSRANVQGISKVSRIDRSSAFSLC